MRNGSLAGCVALLMLGGCIGEPDAVGMGERWPVSALNVETTGTEASTSSSGPTSLSGPSGSSESGEETPAGFLMPPDWGSQDHECSLWLQNCADGEKCTVWSPNGFDIDGTRCVEVAPDPDLEDETCRGDRITGVDTCEAGTFCWDMDPETQLGVCLEFCGGSENAPICNDPAKSCNFTKRFSVCLGECEPLLNDCPVGCGCYPIDRNFQCVPDASEDGGGYLERCEFINACDPGLACLNADVLPCDDPTGTACCGAFCDLSSPGCPVGQECVPAFEEGDAPPIHENVGYCLLPEASDGDAEPGLSIVVP